MQNVLEFTKLRSVGPRALAKQLAKHFRPLRPDAIFLSNFLKELRVELEVSASRIPKKLPTVPSDEDVKKVYELVCSTKNTMHMILMKTLLFTGVRVSELVRIKLDEIDLDTCQIRIVEGKGKKDRVVPFSTNFKETLMFHIDNMKRTGSKYLLESSWHRPFAARTVRHIMMEYGKQSGLKSLSPHQFRHYLFTWLKRQGIDDALIQPYSGHSQRKTLEVYSRLSITDAQTKYNEHINKFIV